jgi:hypothetical protein
MATGDYSGMLMAGKRNAIEDIGRLGEGIAGLGGAFRQRQLNRDIRGELEKGEGHDIATDFTPTQEEATQAHMPGLKPLIAMGVAPLTMTPLRGSIYTPERKEGPRIPVMMAPPGSLEPKEKPFIEPTLARRQILREHAPGTDWKKVESLAREAEARGLKPMIGSAEIESRRRYEDQRELENRKLEREQLVDSWKSLVADGKQARYESDNLSRQIVGLIQSNPQEAFKTGSPLNKELMKAQSEYNTALKRRDDIEGKISAYGVPDWMYTLRDPQGKAAGEEEIKTYSSADVNNAVDSLEKSLGRIKNNTAALTPSQIIKQFPELEDNPQLVKAIADEYESRIGNVGGAKKKAQEDFKFDKENKEQDYNNEMKDWQADYPNFQKWQDGVSIGESVLSRAKTAYGSGNYGRVIEILNAHEEESKIGVKLFGVSFKPGGNYSDEDARNAMKEYYGQVSSVKSDYDKAKEKREEIKKRWRKK